MFLQICVRHRDDLVAVCCVPSSIAEVASRLNSTLVLPGVFTTLIGDCMFSCIFCYASETFKYTGARYVFAVSQMGGDAAVM